MAFAWLSGVFTINILNMWLLRASLWHPSPSDKEPHIVIIHKSSKEAAEAAPCHICCVGKQRCSMDDEDSNDENGDMVTSLMRGSFAVRYFGV